MTGWQRERVERVDVWGTESPHNNPTYILIYCAGLFKEVVNKIDLPGNEGEKKVAALVTDNAAVMRLARELLVAMPGYMHIIQFRCIAQGSGKGKQGL